MDEAAFRAAARVSEGAVVKAMPVEQFFARGDGVGLVRRRGEGDGPAVPGSKGTP